MLYTDSVSKRFLEYSSPSWRNSYAISPPDKFLDYQDPTYIGFYLRFTDLNQRPLTGKENVVGLDEWPGGLFYDEKHPDSAIGYLKNIGEYTRAAMLKEFTEGIKQVSRNMPWYFTKVSGLETIWQINLADSFRGKDKILTFDTLESIDLKITYLMDLYRKAVYDSVYMRWMLPDNLRVFSMDLVITEIRSIQRPADVIPASNEINIVTDIASYANPIKGGISGINIPGLSEQAIQSAVSAVIPNSSWSSGLSNALINTLQRDPGNNSPFPVIMKDFDDLATFLVFRFGLCEFDAFAAAPTYFGTLGKAPEAAATNKMTIKTPVIREFNTYGLLGAIVEDTLSASTRSVENAEANFWKKSAEEAVAGKTPSSEIGYLQGVKNEQFNNGLQNVHQNSLKDENTRLGGLLGGLLQTAATVAGSAINNAVSGAVANILLGNVFSDTFGPTVGASIAKNVALTAPPFINELLTNVALEGAGIDLVAAISPSTTELNAAPIADQNVSPVTFAAPTLSPIGATTVELQEAPVGVSTSSTVLLEGATISGLGSTTVDLSGPGVGPLLSPRVDLSSPPTNPSLQSKTDLIAPPMAEINPGAVSLDGIIPSAVGNEAVTLSSPPVSAASVGSVILDAPAINTDGPGKVSLDAAAVIEGTPGSVPLTAAIIAEAAASSVSLESPPPSNRGAIKVNLVDNGATSKGSVGSVKLEEASQAEGAISQVELKAAEVTATKPGSVTLNEPAVKESDRSKVVLESPLSNNVMAESVELTSPTIINATPAKVELTNPILFDQNLGKETLNAPLIQNIELGKTTLESAEASKVQLSNVSFKAPTISDDYVGKVVLQSPILPVTEPGSVDFTGPRINTDTIGIGTVPQTEAPPSADSFNAYVPQTGAPSQLDINSLGNAKLDGAPSSSEPNTTQRSEP